MHRVQQSQARWPSCCQNSTPAYDSDVPGATVTGARAFVLPEPHYRDSSSPTSSSPTSTSSSSSSPLPLRLRLLLLLLFLGTRCYEDGDVNIGDNAKDDCVGDEDGNGGIGSCVSRTGRIHIVMLTAVGRKNAHHGLTVCPRPNKLSHRLDSAVGEKNAHPETVPSWVPPRAPDLNVDRAAFFRVQTSAK